MSNLFSTSDLQLAAVLYSLKPQNLTNMTRSVRGRCSFIFEDQEWCRAVEMALLQNQVQVSARDLLDAWKTLKVKIHEGGDRYDQ